MSADWAAGDLALCVDGGPCRCGCGGEPGFESGRTYEVAGVRPSRDLNGLQIYVGVRDRINFHGENGWWFEARFRKIRPDEHEACEPEFVTLLKRRKVSA